MTFASLDSCMPLTLKKFMERQFREPRRQDPYRSTTKPAGTPQCPTCKGILIRGKWYPEDEALEKLPKRLTPKAKSARPKELCPACRQLKEKYAQGVVEIHGESWHEIEDLIDETIRNTARTARVRNDQQRILWTSTWRNVAKYYVSLPDLARQIGRVLGRTFKGSVEFQRSTEEPYLRVVWNSDPQLAAGRPTAGATRRTSRRWRNRGARSTASQGADALASKGKMKRHS